MAEIGRVFPTVFLLSISAVAHGSAADVRGTGPLSLDNLTDEDYSEPIGYQPLRRVVRAGVRVAF